MTTETALTLPQRAAVALGSSVAEQQLIELAAQSKSITAITNAAGRQECHAAAMTAAEARIAMQKTGKTAREDATAFSKAVIAEESRLVALIEPEEKRLKAIRDEWDAKVKAEKEAKEAAERARIAAIVARIEAIKRIPVACAAGSAHEVSLQCVVLQGQDIDDSFGEFFGEAMEAKAATLATLNEMHAAKQRAEEEAARAKAEQAAEAARLAEERRQQAAEDARLKAEREAFEKRQAEQRAKEDAERKAEIEKLAQARAEFERERKEIEAADAKWFAEERAALAFEQRRHDESIAAAQKAAETDAKLCVEEDAKRKATTYERDDSLVVAIDAGKGVPAKNLRVEVLMMIGELSDHHLEMVADYIGQILNLKEAA